jgi:hypothetical protein
MNNCLKYILLLLFICLGFRSSGQVNDAGMWLDLNLEKKITPVLSACFTEEIRLNENITEVGLLYSDLGLSYKFGNKFKLGANYRFTKKKRLDDTYQNFHSWYFDASYREKLKPVNMILRLRYQSKYTESFTWEDGVVAKSHIRTKLTLKYDLNEKFEPYAYGEAFFRLNDPVYYPFDQLRLCAGVEYTFNRMHKIDLYYLICKEYNVKHPETDFVIGVSYSVTF